MALVANIMTMAPMNIAALRKAMEAEVEKAVLIMRRIGGEP